MENKKINKAYLLETIVYLGIGIIIFIINIKLTIFSPYSDLLCLFITYDISKKINKAY